MKELMLLLGVAAVLTGTAVGDADRSAGSTRTAQPSITAVANLIDANGRGIGRVRLRQAARGLLVEVNLEGAVPGVHGVHVHDVGRCERPTFASAGGHFNPTGRQHGFLNPRGHHSGDLPNIEVPAGGRLTAEYFVADLTLEAGARSLLDDDGAAIVLHAGRDDYATDPAGESGDRLACGQIVGAETR